MDIYLKDVPRRKYNVFIGSGVYANLIKDYPDQWMNKSDYDEIGVNIIKRFTSTGI